MVLLVVSFLAGMLTVLAPCVLPLLPVILAGSVTDASDRRRPVIIIVSLSISVFIFTLLLKGSTALISSSPTLWNYVSAVILAGFGLTLLFPETWARLVLKIPGHNKPDRWISRGFGGKKDVWSDIVVGAALGPVFTTCSPTFFVILATVLPQSLTMGLIDLAAYIFGLAIVLLIVAWIGQRIVGKLGWAIDPKGSFRKVLGLIFIILAAAIAIGFDKKIEASILNSGFFDVTTVEQSIHRSLQGQTSLPGYIGPSNVTPSQNASSSRNIAGSDLGLPPPPQERDEGRYIEIKDPAGFVNSDPFKLADIIGKKVILIDFIDYSCINCERTFPALNQWWSKYSDQGLEIVAIHTPEFSFEKDKDNVTAAARQYGLKFPIVLDNDYATWNAYGNEYWPHKYFIDIHGNVVYDYIGEGNDSVLESEIVKLLEGQRASLGLSSAISVGTSTAPDYSVQAESPETYFGAMRNEYFGNGAPTIKGDSLFVMPSELVPNEYYLGGKWHIDQEYTENISASSTLSYVFTASKMYMVAAKAGGSPIEATVLLDGSPIPLRFAGADVKDGKLRIDSARLYSLYSNPSGTAERHTIDIIFSKPGARAFTFTFG